MASNKSSARCGDKRTERVLLQIWEKQTGGSGT